MAKKIKKANNIRLIVGLVGIVFAIAALICLAGAGLAVYADNGELLGSTELPKVIFGETTTQTIPLVGDITVKAPISIMGLIGFILTIVGLLIALVAVFKKSKILLITAGATILVSGIFMFLLQTAGTTGNITAGEGVDIKGVLESLGANLEFSKMVEGTSLGVGTILYGVFGILSGLTLTASAFLKK